MYRENFLKLVDLDLSIYLCICTSNNTFFAESFGIRWLSPIIWCYWKSYFHVYDLEILFHSETGSDRPIQGPWAIVLYALFPPICLHGRLFS